jgi:polar amino acid transport system permease protein
LRDVDGRDKPGHDALGAVSRVCTCPVVFAGITAAAGVTYQFRFDVVFQNLSFLLDGLEMTLVLSFLSLVISIVGGLVLALMALARSAVIRGVNLVFGEIIRSTPILVQLFWVYYVIPLVLNVRLSATAATLIGLSVYSSAFIAEVFRAGIQAVPVGQREAAQVVGLSPWQTFHRIVLPQAIRLVLPPLATNFVTLIKYSSLGSVFSVAEITRQAVLLTASTFRPLEIFTFIAVVYFMICWPLTLSIRVWERRLAQR